jgi:hypothetical protein
MRENVFYLVTLIIKARAHNVQATKYKIMLTFAASKCPQNAARYKGVLPY